MHFGGSPFDAFFGGMGGGMGEQPQSPANTTEYYETLDVDKNASDADIKKAYRKAAMKNHPDRGGDESLFKKINEAYEVLSDSKKREVYDSGGKDAVEHQNSQGDQADMMSSMFGGFGRKPTRSKSKDAVHTLAVSLEECYNGKTRKLAITRNELCKECNGLGGEKGCETKCNDCNGRGMIMKMRQIGPGMIQQIQTNCDTCNGKGRMINPKLRCKQCNGAKIVKARKILEVVIDKGVTSGHKLRFRGESDQLPDPSSEAGDVIFVLKVNNHNTFTRKGQHLFIKKKITLSDALCGTTFNVKHLDDRVISVSSKPGQILNYGSCKEVEGEGMPLTSNPFLKGKLVIQFQVEFPKQLSIEQRQSLQSILSPSNKNTELPIHVDEHYVMDDFDENAASKEYQSNQSAYESDDDNEPAGQQNVQCAQG